MREYLELRVNKARADEVFRRDEGVDLGGSVRKILVRTDDERMPLIGELQWRRPRGHPPLFWGYYYVRR